ncbi:hypothetical protein VMCG_08864 [Cytospora schulzeri]|uniref:Uncharacterized protein n=1 Tax=Cytospora schulzeri TaxID=448051 RepID=A0A423VUW6_9PEZI|nr:hypothetical protein VMCG_08864 [Valsa malicola]
MVKLVHSSMAQELAMTKANLEQTRKELANYKKQNNLLEKELSNYRQQLRCALSIQSPPSSPTSTSTESTEVQPGELHQQITWASRESSTSPPKETIPTRRSPAQAPAGGFARPTKASTAKTVKASSLTCERSSRAKVAIQRPSSEWAPTRDFTGSVLPEEYVYRDGILVKKTYGFLRPTQATANKVKPAHQRGFPRNGDQSFDNMQWMLDQGNTSDGTEAYGQSSGDEWSIRAPARRGLTSTTRWLQTLSFGFEKTFSDQEYKDIMDLHVLPVQTRLEGTCNDWLDGPLASMRINDEFQFRLLYRAREVAQRCYWDFMDAHQPRICRREFPGGWQQVKFEGLLMERQLGEYGRSSRILQLRANSPDMARRTVFDVVQLRHLVSHYDSSGPAVLHLPTVDKHLKNVQKLAIHLYDGDRAAEARGLRAELREAAEATLREVEAIELLAALPFAGYPWSYHHESIFREIRLAMARGYSDFSDYPDAVVRVAEEWDMARSGAKHEPPVWDFEEEEKPSLEKRVVLARRHSVSNVQASFQPGGGRPMFRRRASTSAAGGW